ncbi:Bisdemethoxycurcumin synthase [Dichanthelium oligosanthes]|uniref:Bisdemethoxycurcumin synthase n=1 Tax=Dichanthelium oligosanthes TaxID=888268 RepID=A0A1E5VRM7_9POAL|nr:Bisdemethoxycurcumin synthase [Dichanthelium oligosanthes]
MIVAAFQSMGWRSPDTLYQPLPPAPATAGRVARRTRCNSTIGTSSKHLAAAVDDARPAQSAAVLGIGTANPANCVPQDEYADWYFRVTKSDHLAKLKAKMKKICYNSGIKKRHFHHTADTFRDHPELVDRALPSLDARQAILAPAVPELAAAAASRAIAEWGRPASDVTHLVLATYSGAHMPGADLLLASLLGLRRSTQRTMMYLGGCASGSAALRVAKDVAENNPGARVLVACAELSLVLFRAPHVDDSGTLVMQALFGDGAGAVVVGAAGGDGTERVERPLFEMVSTSQTLIPDSEDAAGGELGEGGLAFCPSPRMPALVRQHVEQCLLDAVAPLGLGGRNGWNDFFWAVHPGGPAILNGVEAELGLAPGKLAASRRVLREYGNMSGPSMIFVLDELRRQRDEMGGGLGLMMGLGPGISVETMVLRAARAS